MEDQSLVPGAWGWIWILAFVALFVGIGIQGMRRTRTGDDFAVARRAYGPYLLVFAFAATIASGSTFMGIPGLAYSKGFPAIWYPAIYPIGIYLGLILAIQLIKRAGDRFRSGSIADFMGQRFDSEFLRIGFAMLSLLLIYYVTAQVVAAATMFEVMLGIDYRAGILLSVGVVALYVTIGGSHADILTDGVQGVLMTAIALLIAGIFFLGVGVEAGGAGGINRALAAQDPALDWNHYFSPGDPIFGSAGLVLLMFVAHLPFAMNPHIGKLVFSLRDSSQLRVFLMLAVPVGSILGFAVLGGLHARALVGEGIRPDAAIPVLFTELFPPAIAAFLGVGILAAIMSTADGLFLAIAVTFSNDLYRRTLAPRIHAHRSAHDIDRIALWISRGATVLAACAAIALAWNPPEFLAVLLWIGVGGIVSGAAGPLLIGSLWRRATRPAAIASFLTGVLLYAAFWLVVGWQNPFGAAGVCVTIASLVMILVSLVTEPLAPEHLRRIFVPDAAATCDHRPRMSAMRMLLLVPLLLLATPTAAQMARFTVVEATIPEMQRAMEEGRTTSRDIVLEYLSRIAMYEGELRATIAVNRQALSQADELDRERSAGSVRGPLHGVPIALKDIIHTLDMPTTGGALAFQGLVPPYEATLTRLLREAGAIILAKTTLTELANWMAVGMPGNYNAVRGFGMNPYDPRPDPRPRTADGRPALGAGGSSSGAGTAVSFWAASVGTETSGSILTPSNQTMLVGIKPTLGRISRWGVIPVTADQDTPGPMARTVTDAAILLGAMESATPDPNDPATGRCERPAGGDYTAFLDLNALRGARIGIPRAFYYDPIVTPDGERRGGRPDAQLRLMEDAIQILRNLGAIVVDPADIPSVTTSDPQRNLLLWPICGGGDEPATGCSSVFRFGMKRDFDVWLHSLGSTAPVPDLSGLREWNRTHALAGTLRFGQEVLDASDAIDLERDRARYERDRARDMALAATEGLDAVIREHRLDALLFPGPSGAAISARPGYPTVIVPFGLVPNAPDPAFPAAFDPRPSPFGVSFAGAPCSEPRLIALAYAFEQATRRRMPPQAFP